jgi:hypothetical protein
MRLPLRYRSWISVTLTAATLVIPFSEGTTTAGQGPTFQDVNIPVTITANHTQLPANLYLSNPISFVCVKRATVRDSFSITTVSIRALRL